MAELRVLTPFQLWAMENRAHLREVHALSIRRQTEHELNCRICRTGLEIAIAMCSTLDLTRAMDESRRLATTITSRRIEGRKRFALASVPAPSDVMFPPRKPFEGIRSPLIYNRNHQPSPELGLAEAPEELENA